MLRPRAASAENGGLSVEERRRCEQLFGRPTGGGIGAGAGRRTSVAGDNEALESANEHTVRKLGGQVSQMRHVALNIQDEVRDQNEYLDGMQGNFDTAGERLQNTLRALQQLASSSSGGHLCILAPFAFFFLIAVWLLLR